MDIKRNTADAALTRAEKMLESARKLNYEDETRQPLIEDAIRVAERGLKAVDPNDQVMRGRLYFVLGSLQAESELFDEAVRSYQEALFVRKAIGDALGAGRAEGNIAGYWRRQATGGRRLRR
jgi:tetratricopeptide (TPR) repeat protein